MFCWVSRFFSDNTVKFVIICGLSFLSGMSFDVVSDYSNSEKKRFIAGGDRAKRLSCAQAEALRQRAKLSAELARLETELQELDREVAELKKT